MPLTTRSSIRLALAGSCMVCSEFDTPCCYRVCDECVSSLFRWYETCILPARRDAVCVRVCNSYSMMDSTPYTGHRSSGVLKWFNVDISNHTRPVTNGNFTFVPGGVDVEGIRTHV